MSTIAVREYIVASGKSAYARWFERLDASCCGSCRYGGLSPLGGQFLEHEGRWRWRETRIDFGPGYRVYFGKDGDSVVILLGGSAKKDQQRAIEQAKAAWAEYKMLKAQQRK